MQEYVTLTYEEGRGLKKSYLKYHGGAGKIVNVSGGGWCDVQVSGETEPIKWKFVLTRPLGSTKPREIVKTTREYPEPIKQSITEINTHIHNQQTNLQHFLAQRDKKSEPRLALKMDEVRKQLEEAVVVDAQVLSSAALRKKQDAELYQRQRSMTTRSISTKENFIKTAPKQYDLTAPGTRRTVLAMNTDAHSHRELIKEGDALQQKENYIVHLIVELKPDIVVCTETPVFLGKRVGQRIGSTMSYAYGRLLYSGDDIFICFKSLRFQYRTDVPAQRREPVVNKNFKYVAIELFDKVARTDVLVIAVHLPYKQKIKRAAAVKGLKEFIYEKQMPTIVIGDFNRNVEFLRKEFAEFKMWVDIPTTVAGTTRGLDNVFSNEPNAQFSFRSVEKSPFTHKPMIYEQLSV
jgi:hypothetical protein